jgi:hypothetical protein
MALSRINYVKVIGQKGYATKDAPSSILDHGDGKTILVDTIIRLDDGSVLVAGFEYPPEQIHLRSAPCLTDHPK